LDCRSTRALDKQVAIMPELNTVDEIYEHVAGALAATVDEPWSEIRLHAEIWTTSIGFTG